jgi:uncharacterized Ntn-hydrolase superfamily protein
MIRSKLNPMANTFSIVARDAMTGQMGIAVQSHWFSVGSVVTWAQAGIGVVATQSLTEISYGPLGLEMMRAGKSAEQALKGLVASDPGEAVRQVAMVDATGKVATHTGSRCIAEAGHVQGESFSVQANMMLNNTVPAAMAKAYSDALADPSADLTERLLRALEAAQAAGGDIRGMQSAAIKVVEAELKPEPWQGVLMELRVEDHPTPLVELRRLVGIQRAYDWMNKGDAMLADGKTLDAFEAYNRAEQLAPEIVELPFWKAVTLADTGKLAEALPVFKEVFAREPIWAELLKRLPASGLIKDDKEMLAAILAQA